MSSSQTECWSTMNFQASINIGLMPNRYCATFMPQQKCTVDIKSFYRKKVSNIVPGHIGELSPTPGFRVS